MPKQVWVGIDPGKSGAVGAIRCDGAVEAWHTPTNTTRTKSPRAKTASGKPRIKTETKYDMSAMVELLSKFKKLRDKGYEVVVGIERQQQQPRDSKQVVFQVGRGQGLWEMACAANGLEYALIMPAVWKPRYVARGANKAASKEACAKLYPKLDMPLVKDEARAEATLIADFVLRRDKELPYPFEKAKKC
jgi:hypothetical protein